MARFSDLAVGDRNLVAVAVETLSIPSAAFFDEARAAALTQAEHDRLAATQPALSTIEVVRIESGTMMMVVIVGMRMRHGRPDRKHQ